MIWSIDFDSGAGSGDQPQVDGPVVYSADGTCGPQNGNTYCSASNTNYNGTCCSESGYCGSTEAYCSTGCISGCTGVEVVGPDWNSTLGITGPGSGYVYIDPSIWTDPNPQVHCEPPCILVLPPLQLSSATTITFPALTTDLVVESLTSIGTITQVVYVTQKTTTSIPSVTTTQIEVWAITIFPNDTTLASFTPVQSVMPPPVLLTIPGTEFFAPPPTAAASTGNSLSTAVSLFSPPVFPPSQTVTVQPQPTYSITSLPPAPTVTYRPGPPNRLCFSNCGHTKCNWLPISLCGTTSDSCGIWGCGSGCGLFGCGSDCPLCIVGPPGGSSLDGSAGDELPPPEPSPTPSQTETATTTTTSCSSHTTTACNTMCTAGTTGCSTICFSLDVPCTPAPAPQFTYYTADIQVFNDDSDAQVTSDADYVASLMNPILWPMDPVEVSGSLFLMGISLPTMVGVTATASSTQAPPGVSSAPPAVTPPPVSSPPPAPFKPTTSTVKHRNCRTPSSCNLNITFVNVGFKLSRTDTAAFLLRRRKPRLRGISPLLQLRRLPRYTSHAHINRLPLHPVCLHRPTSSLHPPS